MGKRKFKKKIQQQQKELDDLKRGGISTTITSIYWPVDLGVQDIVNFLLVAGNQEQFCHIVKTKNTTKESVFSTLQTIARDLIPKDAQINAIILTATNHPASQQPPYVYAIN